MNMFADFICPYCSKEHNSGDVVCCGEKHVEPVRNYRVLVGCESSGTVRDAFARRGWDAWSCDVLPAVNGGQHFQCDVRDVMDKGWDLFIVHPPCTYLTGAAEWAFKPRDQINKNIKPGTLVGADRMRARIDAAAFAYECWSAPVEHIALENPVGYLSNILGSPAQIIQPYQYGADASKKTCLWLKGLPALIADPAQRVPGRLVTLASGKTVERWANQTDSGQNRLPPSADRWRVRSVTYPGIADAMADQWTRYITYEN